MCSDKNDKYHRKEHIEEMACHKKQALEEFKDKKFGMFIHFGLYSMFAGEWNGARIEETTAPGCAEWLMLAFGISRAEYSAYAKEFNPKLFSGEAIALLAKKAGMKYIMLTSKHHDGFSLFYSAYSDYTMEHTAYQKDLVDDLYRGCKKHGIAFGLYYSHSLDWYDGGDGGIWEYKNAENRTHPLFSHNNWDPAPRTFDDYVLGKGVPQVKELLTRYPDCFYIWYDCEYFIPEKFSYLYYKTVYDLAPNCLVSYRVGNGFGDVYCPGDNKMVEEFDETRGAWEAVGTMNSSWGFKSYDNNWKSPQELLFWLVEATSKGGNYMLNIGPKADGSVPEQSVAALQTVGEWLAVYGQAIYGTRPFKITVEGPRNKAVYHEDASAFESDFSKENFYFTQKENRVYVISLHKGSVQTIKVRAIKELAIAEIHLLGSEKPLPFTVQDDHVEVALDFVANLGFALEVITK